MEKSYNISHPFFVSLLVSIAKQSKARFNRFIFFLFYVNQLALLSSFLLLETTSTLVRSLLLYMRFQGGQRHTGEGKI